MHTGMPNTYVFWQESKRTTWPTKPQTLGQNWLVEAASTAFLGLHLQPQQTTHMFFGLGPNSPNGELWRKYTLQ